MLDINLFRAEKGGNPDLVRESQRRRFADVSLVDKVRAAFLSPPWHPTDPNRACFRGGRIGSLGVRLRSVAWSVERRRSESTMRTAGVHALC